MRIIDRSEILGLGEYEQIRERFRARVIQEKKLRRVALGPSITAVFENRDTVLLQIQEMLRTERITTESATIHEIETYNELIPGDGQLSITLFVEVPDHETRERLLMALAGLDEAVALEVDGERFAFAGKRVGAAAERTTAVHYLKCSLSAEAVERVRSGRARVVLVVTHPSYAARTELGQQTVTKVADDLT